MGFFKRLQNKSDSNRAKTPVNSLQSIIDEWSSHVFGMAKLYSIELDYSEESIEKIDQLCDIIHNQIISNPNTKEESIDKASRMIGSYLGEIIIKYLGGKWNLVNNNVIAISFLNSECYPIGKVYKRLKIGREESICLYYTACKNQISKL